MRDLLFAAIVFGLLPVCFLRPWIGILVFTWIGMMSPHRLMWSFAQDIRWSALVGGVTLAGLLITRDRKPVPWNTQLILMAVLLAYFTFTGFFAWVPDSAWDKWTLVTKVIVMAIVGTMVIYGRDRIRWLLTVIALGVGYYGIKGGVWVFLTGGIYSVRGPEGSFMTMNNGIGIGLVMVVPILLVLVREYSHKWQRWCLGLAAALCTISIIFTYSRGAWLGLAVSGALMLVRAKRKALIVIALIPFMLTGMLLAPDKLFDRVETIGTYEQDNSAMQRIHTWIVAWNVAADNPLTGGGFDFDSSRDQGRWFSYGSPDIREHMDIVQSAHSMYFQVLGQHGFVAFGLYLLLVFSTLWKLNCVAKRSAGNPELHWIGNYASAIRISLVGYMVSGAFVSTAYFDMAWIYYSFTAILNRELLDHPGTTQKPSSWGNPARAQSLSDSQVAPARTQSAIISLRRRKERA